MDATVPASPHLDLSGATLSVMWRAPGTHQVLALVERQVWFWTFASPSQPWADVTGTFRCEVSDAESAALLGIGSRALDEQAQAVESSPDGGRLGLLVGAGSRQVWVDAGSALASDVQEATAPLLAEQRARPVSAVRLRAAMMTPPAGEPVLALTFAAIGTEPSTLRLHADSVRLFAADGNWHGVLPPRMGLVDGSGALLDGLYDEAIVPAGGLGAWVIPGSGAEGARRVQAAGTIQVTGPIPAATAAFEVSAEIG